MGNKIILLVEDNHDEEVLALRALKRCEIPHEVVVVRDGAEALDYLFATGKYSNSASADSSPTPREGIPPIRQPCQIPELILLDVKLPKINGLEVLRRIRADDRTKHAIVVMLSTSTEKQDLIESYNLGCNSYIRKPVDFVEFNKVMEQLGLYWLLFNQNVSNSS